MTSLSHWSIHQTKQLVYQWLKYGSRIFMILGKYERNNNVDNIFFLFNISDLFAASAWNFQELLDLEITSY